MTKRPRFLPRRERLRQIERHTLERQPGDLRTARRVYRKELSASEQFELAQEIVETRGAELCRAFGNVIDVTHGYKERRDKRSGKARLQRIPCVIFIVKQKWQDDGQPDQRIPDDLFAYWNVGGDRKLCAVPTDVQVADRRLGIRPEARGAGVTVEASNWPHANGVLSCVVQRSAFPKNRYAISCRHVFSISKAAHSANLTGANVTASSRSLARTISVKGDLGDEFTYSLDAQLAKITDTAAAAHLMRNITVTDFIRSPDQLPNSYWLLRRNRDPIHAWFRGYFTAPIDYGHPGIHAVVHRRLFESELDEPTADGDSGAPLFTGKHGGLLIGMHIAGDNAGTSVAIPAWQFMYPDLYKGAASSEIWTPL